MILLQSKYDQELIQIINEVKKASYSSFVQKYVSYPELNILQLHFTYIFLKYVGCSIEECKSYTISQAFISLGEDSHDLVTLAEGDGKDNSMVRQLTVLSGDFFSSHYYYYLAQKNQIDLIQKWSEVIKGINEKKADLHSRAYQHSDVQYQRNLFLIKDDLTLAILKWFNAPDYFEKIFSLLMRLYRESSIAEAERIAKEKYANLLDELKSLIQQCDREVSSELMIWIEKLSYVEKNETAISL